MRVFYRTGRGKHLGKHDIVVAGYDHVALGLLGQCFTTTKQLFYIIMYEQFTNNP